MVVVGFDGREGGEDACELGRLLADGLGTELLTVSVVGAGVPPRGREELGREGSRRVTASSVAAGLSDVATEVGASAVVVGSSRRGRVGRTLFGTDVEHVAQEAPCPVAVAPVGYSRRYAARLRRIEVSFDGSTASAQAMGLAGQLAAADDGSVRVHARREVREAAERYLTLLPRNVTYEIESGDRDDLDGLGSRDGDALVLGRSSAHARIAHALPLLLI